MNANVGDIIMAKNFNLIIQVITIVFFVFFFLFNINEF